MAYQDTGDTPLGKSIADRLALNPGASGFMLLGDDLDAFVARMILMQNAEKSIDAQYYLLHSDLTGSVFVYGLIQAADRGVRVRLLLDDIGLQGKDRGILALNSHPNIEVRVFNPFDRSRVRLTQFLTGFGKVTRRMHNKTFTVDNQVSIVGGRNIGDEYFAARPDLVFRDLDVACVGPVVKEVSHSFDTYWNHRLAYPADSFIRKVLDPEEIKAKYLKLKDYVSSQADSRYHEAAKNTELLKKVEAGGVEYQWGSAEAVYDSPDKLLNKVGDPAYQLTPQLKKYIDQLQDELVLISPYFVPGREGTKLLTGLRKKGVRVRILTNSLASTDVGVVHAGYANYRNELLRAGVELYELDKQLDPGVKRHLTGSKGASKSSLHAKAFVIDRKTIFIGSLNMDPRSLIQNTEVGVVFDSEKVGTTLADWFDDNIDRLAFRLELVEYHGGNEEIVWHGTRDGQPVTYTSEPYAGPLWRFIINILRILPVESQI